MIIGTKNDVDKNILAYNLNLSSWLLSILTFSVVEQESFQMFTAKHYDEVNLRELVFDSQPLNIVKDACPIAKAQAAKQVIFKPWKMWVFQKSFRFFSYLLQKDVFAFETND